ncbi:MAG: LptA/OstA family protein [Armatimonadota bacterium]|nr:LptA/OstA family protein [Armatimonadota bacterium]
MRSPGVRAAALVLGLLVLLPSVAVPAPETGFSPSPTFLPAPTDVSGEVPVLIRADAFRYDRRTRVLVATGNVVLTFEDVTIDAHALVANLETGEVTAEGHVRLRVGAQEATAELLTYNLRTRLGVLHQARARVTSPMVLGPVHLRAQRLEGVLDRTVSIREGFVTTCDPDVPLVFLTADEIAVFLNDKVVGRRASLWIAGQRVVTLPSFIIFLRERQATRFFPVVGYSPVEGWFVKTHTTYFLNEGHWGFVLADYMERLGTGLGVEHAYRLSGGRGQGTALVYRLANRQTGGTDWRVVVNHAQDLAPALRLNLFGDYTHRAPGGTPSPPATSDLFTALDLSHRTTGATTFLYATYSSTSVGPAQGLTGTLVHSQALSPEMSGEAVLTFTRAAGTAGVDDELLPRLVLRHFRPGFSASLVAETRWDLDGDVFPADQHYTLERLPELTVTLAPFALGRSPFVLQVEGGLGRFREQNVTPSSLTDAVRADALLTLSGPVPAGGGTLFLRAFGRASWYTTGDLRLFTGGRAEYVRPLGPTLELRGAYTTQEVAGQSPFLFDQIAGPLSIGEASLTYRAPGLFVRALATYDFLTRQPGSVVAQAVALPRPEWTVALAASYSPMLGRLERAEASLDLRLSPQWQVQYLGLYDGFTGQVFHDRLTVTRVFCDCLAVSLSYLGVRGEIWLEAWLTAIPWGRGRIGLGQSGLLFDQPLAFPGSP